MNAQEAYAFYRTRPEQDMWDYSQFLRHHAKGNVLEIGTRYGVSTAALLCGVKKNGGHVWSVDINPTCAELYRDDPNWTFLCADSKDVTGVMERVNQWPIDVLFIDGDHSKEGFTSDLYGYHPYVRRDGGLILVHDICPPPDPTPEMVAEGWPGEELREVYQNFLCDWRYVHFELPGKFGLGVIRV